MQLFLTSLIAAVPAGFLTYLAAMMIVNQSENLSTTLMGILGVTAGCGVVATIGLPVMSLMPSRSKSGKSSAKSDESVADVETAGEDDFGELDAVEVAEDEDLGETSDFEASDADLFEESGEFSNESLSDTDLLDDDEDSK